MNNSKQIEIFLKNYEETIEKTISESFAIEMKRLKEVEEQNARLTDEMRKCEEYADRLNKENEELKTYIQKMDKPKIKTIDSKIALKNIELQEENKKLKESADEAKIEYENLLINRNDYAERAEKLEQENKELKEINTALIQEGEDIAEARMEICNQCGNRDDYNIPCKMIRDLDYGLTVTIDERDKYEQALEEIRKISETAKKDICNNCGWRNSDSCDPTDYTCNEFNKILNKINEVLNDRD